MKKTHLVIGFTIALMLTIVSTSGALAFFGKHNRQNRNANPEHQAQMQQILENKDFEGWKALERASCEARINEMTEEDFNTFAERHTEQMKKGEAIRNAMEAGDYAAWKTAIADTPQKGKMFENVDEATFAKMVEAHKLMQAGDFKGARAIQKEIGKGFGMPGNHRGPGKGHRLQE